MVGDIAERVSELSERRSFGPLAALALMALLCLASVGAQAQSYAIEMIVFANTDDEERYTEAWRADPGLPDTSRATPISAGSDVSAVGSSGYRLSGAWQALRNSGQFRPIQHLAWTQRGRPARSAPEILIGDGPSSAVYGTVRMSRSRFLHLDLDLLLNDGSGSYRFINHRRMRSNELNYIDHPMFGILVIATRR